MNFVIRQQDIYQTFELLLKSMIFISRSRLLKVSYLKCFLGIYPLYLYKQVSGTFSQIFTNPMILLLVEKINLVLYISKILLYFLLYFQCLSRNYFASCYFQYYLSLLPFKPLVLSKDIYDIFLYYLKQFLVLVLLLVYKKMANYIKLVTTILLEDF